MKKLFSVLVLGFVLALAIVPSIVAADDKPQQPSPSNEALLVMPVVGSPDMCPAYAAATTVTILGLHRTDATGNNIGTKVTTCYQPDAGPSYDRVLLFWDATAYQGGNIASYIKLVRQAAQIYLGPARYMRVEIVFYSGIDDGREH